MKQFDEEAAKAGAPCIYSGSGLSHCNKANWLKYHGRNYEGRLILEMFGGEIDLCDDEDVEMVDTSTTSKHYIGLGRHDGKIKTTQTCESADLAAISMPSSWELIKVIEVEV